MNSIKSKTKNEIFFLNINIGKFEFAQTSLLPNSINLGNGANNYNDCVKNSPERELRTTSTPFPFVNSIILS